VNAPAMIRKTIYTQLDPDDEDACEFEPEPIGLVEVTSDCISLTMYGHVLYRGSLEQWAWSQVLVDGEDGDVIERAKA
jgi:hypothetical protein